MHKVCMGFDFGTKKIGVAIGQTITQTATALELIKVKNNKPHWQQIDKLVHSWQPTDMVVGWPLNMDGSESELIEKVSKFIKQLEQRYHIECHKVDERLTTRQARQLLEDHHEKNIALDSVAALILVQNWCDMVV